MVFGQQEQTNAPGDAQFSPLQLAERTMHRRAVEAPTRSPRAHELLIGGIDHGTNRHRLSEIEWRTLNILAIHRWESTSNRRG
jgi:hypothetical protein